MHAHDQEIVCKKQQRDSVAQQVFKNCGDGKGCKAEDKTRFREDIPLPINAFNTGLLCIKYTQVTVLRYWSTKYKTFIFKGKPYSGTEWIQMRF